MLIKALCDYYDILAERKEILPDGYSNVKIHYLICLNQDGGIERILPHQEKIEIGKDKKGNIKTKLQPLLEKMPERSEKPGIDANYIEHRPLYLFGLNYVEEKFTPQDRTNKAVKSHQDFMDKNLEFIEGIETPVVNAYRAFIQNWIPEVEQENPWLLQLGKAYASSGFAFCLEGHPEILLHEDEQINKRWMERKSDFKEKDARIAQCAVTGEMAPIARIHGKIKGVPGGLATGSVLIGFNNSSENSYGNEQSYNSNVSQNVMKKYTEALNYLLSGWKHKAILDDLTVVFWSASKSEKNDTLMASLMFYNDTGVDKESADDILRNLMEKARKGKIVKADLNMEGIDPDVDFYMLGLKPNSSRISVKFFYKRRYGDVLYNIAQHQLDMQMSENGQPIPIYRIEKELVSPKSKNDKISPALLTKLLESIFHGRRYPGNLMGTVVRRIKTDKDVPLNPVRAGIVKGVINRNDRLNGKKEEFEVGLDKENTNQAYLCGRLFAILENIQNRASGGKLNRTIKDAYFASASSKPVMIFPKLLKLSHNHLKKLSTERKGSEIFYNKLIGEVMDEMEGNFPGSLSIAEQGEFMVGYYQQMQSLYANKTNSKESNQEVNENDN